MDSEILVLSQLSVLLTPSCLPVLFIHYPTICRWWWDLYSSTCTNAVLALGFGLVCFCLNSIHTSKANKTSKNLFCKDIWGNLCLLQYWGDSHSKLGITTSLVKQGAQQQAWSLSRLILEERCWYAPVEGLISPPSQVQVPYFFPLANTKSLESSGAIGEDKSL